MNSVIFFFDADYIPLVLLQLLPCLDTQSHVYNFGETVVLICLNCLHTAFTFCVRLTVRRWTWCCCESRASGRAACLKDVCGCVSTLEENLNTFSSFRNAVTVHDLSWSSVGEQTAGRQRVDYLKGLLIIISTTQYFFSLIFFPYLCKCLCCSLSLCYLYDECLSRFHVCSSSSLHF